MVAIKVPLSFPSNQILRSIQRKLKAGGRWESAIEHTWRKEKKQVLKGKKTPSPAAGRINQRNMKGDKKFVDAD